MKQKRDYSIFNRKFFNFSFKLIASKISIYVGILIYLLIITCYAIIVPRVSNNAPISLYSLSTPSMFLMFAVAIITCYIAIEIFRTGIDDGTELLVVSKPISRKEIVFVKLLVFLIYVFSLALLGMGISAFTFLDSLSTNYESAIIMVGTLVGTIVNGLIFGSIVTILSIYFKKITSMLISVGIAFILMMASMLTAFIIQTPVQTLYNSNKTLQTVNAISVDNNGNASVNQGLIGINNQDGNLSYVGPEDIWNNAVKNSGYNNSIKFDLGYQLSSIFVLNHISYTTPKLLSVMNVLNQGANLKFSDYNTTNMSHINVTVKNKNATTKENTTYGMSLYLNTGASSSIRSIGSFQKMFNVKTSYQYADFLKINNEVYNFGNSSTTKDPSKYWTDAWNKYGKNSTSSKENSSNSSSSDNELKKFVKKVFTTNNNTDSTTNTIDSKNAETLIKKFNKIQYSAYLNLMKNGITIDLNNSNGSSSLTSNSTFIDVLKAIAEKLNDEQKVELGLLGINLYDIDNPFSSSLDFKTDNGVTYTVSNLFNLFSEEQMKTAKVTSVTSVLKNDIVIPVWVSVAIIMFIISMVLYYKRDFA